MGGRRAPIRHVCMQDPPASSSSMPSSRDLAGSTAPRRCRIILVVDDDDDVRDVLRDVLEDEGYKVCTAANGRDALDRLKALVPCLIVLDLMMPIMDGA